MYKRNSKILAALLTIVLVFSIFPSLRVNAESSGTCGTNLTWTLDDEGTLTISGTGNRITEHAFKNNTSIKTVIAPDCVTSIGSYAFNGCTSLETVSLPGVTSIDSSAFKDCTSLENVSLPGVTSIDSSAFKDCTSLENVSLPGVISIESYVFNGCTSLKTISIPSVTSIGSSAFQDCTSLETISIPDSVTSITSYAFAGCTNLETISIPDSVTSITSYAFEGCTSLETISIPDSVTSIGNGAFKDCTSLETISIPDSVTSITYYVFAGCTSLKTISIPDSVTSITSYAFAGCTSLETVSLPGVTSIETYAFNGCTSLETVSLPGVTSIETYAFIGCPSSLKINYSDITITYKDDSNGTVTGYVPGSDPTTVYLTFTPNTGYVVNTVTVTDNTGTTTINPDSSDNYSFPLPSGDATVDATFKLVQKKVTFKNEDGTVLQTGDIDYGTTPTYTGTTPTKSEDEQYTYSFAGWSDGTNTYGPTDTLPAVTDDATYTAVFDSTVRKFTIKFINEDGTILKSGEFDYGTTPAYTGSTPTKAEDDQYTYAFAGWSDGTKTYGPTDTLPAVTDDATYTAVFDSTVKQYTIKFVDEDGSVLQSGNFDYGTTPVYTGTTPTKAEDDKYTYTFSGWTPAIASVTGNATYTATFTETAKTTTAPTTPAPTTPAPTTPAPVTAAKPGTYYLSSMVEQDGNIVVTIKMSEDDTKTFDLLGTVTSDGVALTEGNQYTAAKGSAIITINKSFLDTLAAGNHKLTVTFTDGGSITIDYEVKAPATAPQADAQAVQATGEATDITAVAGVGMILTACAVTLFAMRKRRKEA